MTGLVAWLHRNADDCEDQSRWATPELAPFLREAATALEAKDKEIEALRADFAKLSDMAKESERLRSGALEVAEQWQARAETAERELDVLSSSHRDLAKRLADMGRERDEAGWHTFADKPKAGRKFIALHNDGSGAAMFFAFDGGVIDSDGDEYYDWNPDETSYDRWAYLPDNLEFWCEIRAEDPVSLRAARAIMED